MSAWARRYLYFGSFVGVALFAVGATSLLTAAFALAFGTEAVYGSIPVEAAIRTTQQQQELQRSQDAIRGATFAVFGLVFWAGHWARDRIPPGDRGSARRAYALIGTVAYALVAVVLLPTGISQALSFWLLPPLPGGYRGGVGQTLAGGLVALGIWLLFLRLLLGERRSGRAARGWRGGPPPEGAGVGARIGPGPVSRSAGAEAIPPRED